MNINIHNELEKLIKKALEEDEVPISAIVVQNNKIIGRGYNKVEQTQNFMNHAEIIALNEAINYKKNWRLDDCEIHISLEPCNMCKEIIKKSRIKKVYYYSAQNDNNIESEPKYYFKNDSFFSEILKKFFKNVRNNK